MNSSLSQSSFLCLALLANSCGGNRPQVNPHSENKSLRKPICPGANDVGNVAVDTMLMAYADTKQYSDLGKIVDGNDKTKTKEVRFRTNFEASSSAYYRLSFDSGMARYGTRENNPPWLQFLVLKPESSSFHYSGQAETQSTNHGDAIAKLEPRSVMAVGIVPALLSRGELPYVKRLSDWKGGGTGVVNGFEICKLIGENENRKIEVSVGHLDGLIRRVTLKNLSKGSTTQIDYLKIRRNRIEYAGSGPVLSGPTGSFLPEYHTNGNMKSCPVHSGDWCFWRVQDACAAECPGEPCAMLAVSNPPQVVCGQ